jgi:hypothetical protein
VGTFNEAPATTIKSQRFIFRDEAIFAAAQRNQSKLWVFGDLKLTGGDRIIRSLR